MSKSYQELEDIFRNANLISNAMSILDWDGNVMMPEQSANARSEMVSYLSKLEHNMLTHPKVAELITNMKLICCNWIH